MNVFDLAQRKVKLRKVSITNGGEWQGPCPGCGGNDRFHVWPDQNQGKGGYWCRQCGKTGDNIQFLIEFEGMTFREACAYLNISMTDRPEHFTPTPPAREKPGFIPAEHTNPSDKWMEKAEAFVSWAQENLSKNREALDMLASRGIDRAAAGKHRLGWNPGEKGKDIFRARSSWGLPELKKENGRQRALWIPRGLVIPAIIDGAVVRIRIRRQEGDPRYYVVPGSSSHTMHLESSRRAAVIVETELDAIAIAENNALAGSVAVGTSHGKPDTSTYDRLKNCLQILVALDFDQAGIGGMKWWNANFDRCDYWPVPCEKDPGEAYRKGIDLDKWIKAGLPPAMTIADRQAPQESDRPKQENIRSHDRQETETASSVDLSPPLLELHALLKSNPSVTIINTPTQLAIVRNGKYVAGRIAHLVFRVPEVLDYISNHPAERITGENFIL